MAEATALDHLVEKLRRDGSAVVSRDHALLRKQTELELFNGLGARLQGMLGGEDFAMDMTSQENGLLFTLKVGEVADEVPDFSPPEPKLL